MLGKLIKYDMKALSRFLIIIHGFLLFAAFMGRFFITSKITFNEETLTSSNFEVNQFLMSLAFLLFFILVMAASFGTYIIIAVRFYKHLFSDEGYLSHSLPVSKGMHLLSKTISGSIWMCIDTALVFLSLWIVIVTPSVADVFNANKDMFLEVLGFSNSSSFATFIAIFFGYMIIACISNAVLIYTSIVCGQLFANHRILGAVVCYLGIQTIISIVSLVFTTFGGFLEKMSYIAVTDSFNINMVMNSMFIYTGVLTIAITVVCYGLSYYLMQKKVNLQ